MTTASSSGTARVRLLNSSHLQTTHRILEYLRGTATSDDCEPLFKQYEQCLKVPRAQRDAASVTWAY
jgi:hypothetical protein